MLSNVVDIDMEAMTVSLTSEKGAIVLFDFQAAFPSLSHEYLLDVLERIGMPKTSMNFVKALYNRTKCVISCKGGVYEGFDQTAGIRQGCPLSPLLFAVTVDMFLRRLAKTAPESMVRAFADDTAVVLADLFTEAGPIMEQFKEFAKISGMELNLPKTVVIPLWHDPLDTCRKDLQRNLPDWSEVRVDDASTYLGFVVGPGRGMRSWDKPTRKFSERAKLWSTQGVGLQYAALTYNVFAMSILSFVSQLENPPQSTYQAEQQALRGAAKGPYNWAMPDDLWHLHDLYGQARAFHSLRVLSWASKVRVATWEPLTFRGKSLKQRALDLEAELSSTDFAYRKSKWSKWYAAAHANTLVQALRDLENKGIRVTDLTNKLSRGTARPWSERVQLQVKGGYQKLVSQRLLWQTRPDAENRVRAKLERWRLPDPPAHVAQRILRRLQRVRELVPPRVGAAYFSTLWNRWTTARRFQRRGTPECTCVLGCGGLAEDSIEHYACCAALRLVARRFLRLDSELSYGLQRFLIAEKGDPDDEDLVCRAVLVYAMYMATNHFRPLGGTDQQRAVAALEQYCRNAVRGHLQSERVIDGRWRDGPTPMALD
jgi:hypothetical protein